jgi:hypothetical protein
VTTILTIVITLAASLVIDILAAVFILRSRSRSQQLVNLIKRWL